jgi:hypothetical protein
MHFIFKALTLCDVGVDRSLKLLLALNQPVIHDPCILKLRLEVS